MVNITLTNKAVIELFQALTKLDPGLEDYKAKSAFSFKAKVIYSLARNFKTLKYVAESLDIARIATFKKYQVGEELTLQGEAAANFTKELNEVLDQLVTLPLHQVDVNDLELDRNKVTVEYLGALVDTIVIGELV